MVRFIISTIIINFILVPSHLIASSSSLQVSYLRAHNIVDRGMHQHQQQEQKAYTSKGNGAKHSSSTSSSIAGVGKILKFPWTVCMRELNEIKASSIDQRQRQHHNYNNNSNNNNSNNNKNNNNHNRMNNTNSSSKGFTTNQNILSSFLVPVTVEEILRDSEWDDKCKSKYASTFNPPPPS